MADPTHAASAPGSSSPGAPPPVQPPRHHLGLPRAPAAQDPATAAQELRPPTPPPSQPQRRLPRPPPPARGRRGGPSSSTSASLPYHIVQYTARAVPSAPPGARRSEVMVFTGPHRRTRPIRPMPYGGPRSPAHPDPEVRFLFAFLGPLSTPIAAI
jgi:hypothetical protein